MNFRVLASVCQDGDCPKFLIDDETDVVRVRGTDPDDPTTERDVEIPGATWRQLLALLPR